MCFGAVFQEAGRGQPWILGARGGAVSRELYAGQDWLSGCRGPRGFESPLMKPRSLEANTQNSMARDVTENDTSDGTRSPRVRAWGFGRWGGAGRGWTGPPLGGHGSLRLWIMKKRHTSPGCRIRGDFTAVEASLLQGSKTSHISGGARGLRIFPSRVLGQGQRAVIPDGHEHTYYPDLCF